MEDGMCGPTTIGRWYNEWWNTAAATGRHDMKQGGVANGSSNNIIIRTELR